MKDKLASSSLEDEFLINRLTELETLILTVRREIRDLNISKNDSIPQQYYFTLRQAVELKYGRDFPYTTISTNYALMPCGNTNFKIIAGKRMWDREKILEWIKTCDSDIPSYLEKYNVPLTGRIGEKYLKKYVRKEATT